MADVPDAPDLNPLARYRARRDFSRTPEPADTAPARTAQGLSFVVQEHHARRLHYDFRLELGGVLLSWAVPKGPSMDPADKRMAVRTEDHPLAYAGFEGTIPAGEYGAGTVALWDSGHWTPQGDPQAGLAAGKLGFELHGRKLHGHWELIRLPRRGDTAGAEQTAWLLFKRRDASGEAASATAGPAAVAALPAPLPETLPPQLATAAAAVPPQGHWIFEHKFDGYRLLARIEAGVPRLFTRGGHDWTHKMPRLARALQALALDTAWLDGEVVAGQGGPGAFHRLQNAFDGRGAAGQDDELVYQLFDLPYFEGHDLRAAPLHARRALLQQMLQDRLPAGREPGPLRFSAALGEGGAELGSRLLQAACKAQHEGVIAKRSDSSYRGRRDDSWLKLKCRLRQEFVVGGYTLRANDAAAVGSLVLGVHDAEGRLLHAGSVGTGWDSATAQRLRQRLDKLARTTTPFAPAPAAGPGVAAGAARRRGAGSAPALVHWVQPKTVVEVNFGEWTPAGHIRHASFLGLRSDKPARDIGREPVAAGPNISHPGRVIDAQSGQRKIDLAQYYAAVSAWLLPQLAGRPVALLRAPGGVGAPQFFQKHAPPGSIPGVVSLDPALWPGHEALLEVPTAAALLGALQMNTIEFHTWNARSKNLGKPDVMIFDLDPGEGLAWPAVREGALLTRALLDELGLKCWLKTSGGKGLHLVVPIAARWPYATVKAFSRAVVQHLAATIPARFVAKSGPANRKGRIFVDYLRNGEGATTVAAFSVRARPGLGVSMPITWDELPQVEDGAHWTPGSALERLAALAVHPWADMDGVRQSLAAPMRQLPPVA